MADELSEAQIERQDWVDNACHGLLTELAGGKEIEWDIELIGKVRDAAQAVIVDRLHLMTDQEFYPYIQVEVPAAPEPMKVHVLVGAWNGVFSDEPQVFQEGHLQQAKEAKIAMRKEYEIEDGHEEESPHAVELYESVEIG